MMQYRILECGNLDQLAKAVEKETEQGWIPQGGICAYNILHKGEYGQEWTDTYFLQAMIKLPISTRLEY